MVFALDSYQCVYCGAFAQKQTLDHVVPVRDMVGMPGSIANSVGNLVTACLDCNRKLAHTPFEKKVMRFGRFAKQMMEAL
jgi:5-methylcytosine-specific restriction endonuclease McrA